MPITFDYYWRVKTRLPERLGQRCRVLVRSRRMNSVLVQFMDGTKVVTSAHYVRLRSVLQRELWDMLDATRELPDTENVRLDEEPPR